MKQVYLFVLNSRLEVDIIQLLARVEHESSISSICTDFEA